MKKAYWSIGIDKLALCYQVKSDSILHSITEETTELDFGDFKLRRISSTNFKNAFHILSLWDAPSGKGLDWQVYATLKYSRYTDKEDKIQLAWFYFENKTLYQQLYPNVNTIIFAEFQSNILGLELRNITNIEIAVDTSKNAAKAIKYALRNPNLVTILNGKVLKDRKKVNNEILYVHTGNLERYLDMSIYVKQKDTDGLELKVYDKAKEIKVSSKEYILNWHKLTNNKKLHRIEISLKHQQLKDYINSNKIELTHNLFNNREFLFDCFLHFANRLIRFREGEKVYSILEVI